MYRKKEGTPGILGLGVVLIHSCRSRALWVLWIHLVAWVVPHRCWYSLLENDTIFSLARCALVTLTPSCSWMVG
ncbi:uncharacterized protein BJ171DRAFT_515559 [Polychytrium aggregatum]|uniref:uncharacterized protein n=1 Tax=Polychytrium aggregatum TaxID=110093 RepID=UPI0022FF3490|nr:uncharacterized protein BJ171DRAFT_515559 [Polychytrium aggregatum]KAI9202047.1 hypothetical protein BJ171DRAFT_515559 [Polychytrium aggregatum]